MKTILHVCESFAAGTFYLISQLSTALRDEFQFVILSGVGKETPRDFQRYFPENTRFIPWSVGRDANLMRHLASWKELLAVIREVRPDVVHGHSSVGGGLALMAAFRLGVPTLYTPGGYASIRRDISPLKRAVFRTAEYALGRAPHITVACGETELRRALSVARKAYVICNSVPPTEPRYPDTLSREPLTVVTCGRITNAKNFPLFREIANMMAGDNVRFIWVGGGGEPAPPSLPNNMTITGWVSRSEALARMSAADVYIQTSRWEGLPLSVLEAMTCGKPVVASNIPANRELVLEGLSGFICQSADEFAIRLRGFERDRAALHSMGVEARKIIELRYNPTYAMMQWRALYDNYKSYYRSV